MKDSNKYALPPNYQVRANEEKSKPESNNPGCLFFFDSIGEGILGGIIEGIFNILSGIGD